METEFENSLEFFTIPYEGEGTGIRGIMSFDPPVDMTEHIIDKGEIGKVVNTEGGVLLGKMSFQMTENIFDVSWFSLSPIETTSPETGIKINIGGNKHFKEQSTFRFIDDTASKDADLINLTVSYGELNEEEIENSTYKEYPLTPIFNRDILNYEIELLEYIDKINIMAKKSDINANMKIKVPKRDENNNLTYDTDEQTILYEEKEIKDNIPLEVIINKLGETNTQIIISVIAEDGISKKDYEVVIKRPYGTIKGQIYTAPTEFTTGKYKSDIRIYKSDEVKQKIDWYTVDAKFTDDVHDRLLNLNSIDYETNDDGTYEIYVIPGEYDILLDKAGYLDHIYISKQVKENDVINLGYKELIAGDINKDGCIQILDLSELMSIFGIDNTDSKYDIRCDFNEDSEIQILDLSTIMSNFSEIRRVE